MTQRVIKMRPQINKNSWHFKFLRIRYSENYIQLQTRSMVHYYCMLIKTVLCCIVATIFLTVIGFAVGIMVFSLPGFDIHSQSNLVFNSSILKICGMTAVGIVITPIAVVIIFTGIAAVEYAFVALYNKAKKALRKKFFDVEKVPVFYSDKES